MSSGQPQPQDQATDRNAAIAPRPRDAAPWRDTLLGRAFLKKKEQRIYIRCSLACTLPRYSPYAN
jgi:hypothetical protein